MGTLVFQANLGGAVNLNGPNIASTVNFTLPSADGTNGQALVTNGTGTLSFASVTTAAGGSNTQVQYNNSGAFAGSANLTFNGTTLTAANTSITTSETLSYGTANGVAYLNASKVLTTGTGLVFDGTSLGIATTSPSAKLDVSGTGKVVSFGSSTDNDKYMQINGSTSNFQIGNTGSSQAYLIATGAIALSMYTNNTERARINSSGTFLIGQTSNTYGGIVFAPRGKVEHSINTFNNGDTWTLFLSGASGSTTVRGSIDTNGITLQYSVSSDRRLKENIVDAPNAIDLISSIKVRSFNWKENGQFQKYGFIAQELQEIEPLAVCGLENGEKPMGVDASKLVPHVIKALQELKAEFDAYKTLHP